MDLLVDRIDQRPLEVDRGKHPVCMDAVTVSTNDADQLEGMFSDSSLVDSFRKIYVVDNESTDESAALARKAGAEVVARRRGGYGAAINTGARHTRGDYFAVLNPDVRFYREDAVEQLIRNFDDPRVAIAAPALRLLDGRLQDSARRTPTPLNLLVRRRLDPESGVVRSGGDVDWVVGACFIVRRDVWEAVGGFDESYFLYFDDVDLCTRVRQAGWKVRFDPTVVVEHAWQGASRRQSLLASPTRHHLKSAARFFAKNPRCVVGLPS